MDIDEVLQEIRRNNREVAVPIRRLVECDKCGRKWKGNVGLAVHRRTCKGNMATRDEASS